jgi:hypothetical protein
LCQRPGRWRQGARPARNRPARNRAAAGSRSPAPAPSPAPGGPAWHRPSPAPRSRSRSWWRLRRLRRLRRSASALTGVSRAGGRRERVRRGSAALFTKARRVPTTPLLRGRLIRLTPGRKAFCVSALVDGARMAPGGSGGAESGGGGVAVPGSRPGTIPGTGPSPAPSPAPAGPASAHPRHRPDRRHRGRGPGPGGGFGGRLGRSPAFARGRSERERTAGVCSSFYEGPAGADDPVARRRPVGAPGPRGGRREKRSDESEGRTCCGRNWN